MTNKKPKEIEEVDVFKYAAYIEEPVVSEYKNELWVQLKLLQNKINQQTEAINYLLRKMK